MILLYGTRKREREQRKQTVRVCASNMETGIVICGTLMVLVIAACLLPVLTLSACMEEKVEQKVLIITR